LPPSPLPPSLPPCLSLYLRVADYDIKYAPVSPSHSRSSHSPCLSLFFPRVSCKKNFEDLRGSEKPRKEERRKLKNTQKITFVHERGVCRARESSKIGPPAPLPSLYSSEIEKKKKTSFLSLKAFKLTN